MIQSDSARAVFNDPSAVDLHEALQEFSLFVRSRSNDDVQVWGMGQALITLYWQRFTVNMRKISHGVFEMIETCVPSLN